MTDEDSWAGRLRQISRVGMVVLAFLTGVVVTYAETFPYEPGLKRSLQALQARAFQFRPPWSSEELPASDSRFWSRASSDGRGVVRHVDGEMAPGATLVASMPQQSAELLGPDGETIHRWSRTFHEVWPNASHVASPFGDPLIGWAVARLFDNGDLFVVYHAEGDTPYGYGAVRLDRASEVVWKYSENVHHDAQILPDGGVLTLTQEFSSVPPSLRDEVDTGRTLVDSVVRLSPEGREEKRISLVEAFQRSRYRSAMRMWSRGNERWDMLHTNNVEYVGSDFAEHHAFAEPDDVLLSFRALDAIGLLDMEERRIVWLSRGSWSVQHDPDPLGNGHLMLFDNQGAIGEPGYSRVIEFDPSTREIVWEYAGTESAPFKSWWSGEQVPLSNGNVLVSAAVQPRVFEVTRAGKIVWEYRPERRRTQGERQFAPVFGIQHLDRIDMRRARAIAEGSE